MVNILIVSAKGDIRTNKAAIFTAEGLAKALRKAKTPSQIGTWLVEDGAVELTLWGWREAYAATVKAATFVFPAPHTKLTLYGDAIITATRNGKAVDMSEDMWIAACAEIEEMEDDVPVAAGGAGAAAPAAADDASEADSDADADAEDEDDEFDDAGEEADADEDAEDEEEEGEDDEEDVDDDGEEGDEEEEDGEDDCYDSDDGGGGGKRRAPRRRAMAAPEFRRMDMGLRSRIKMPAPAGKRAPKWQTAPELEPE